MLEPFTHKFCGRAGFLNPKDAENYLRVMVKKLGKIVVLRIASIKGRANHANMEKGIALVLQAGTLRYCYNKTHPED